MLGGETRLLEMVPHPTDLSPLAIDVSYLGQDATNAVSGVNADWQSEPTLCLERK